MNMMIPYHPPPTNTVPGRDSLTSTLIRKQYLNRSDGSSE
jgi:hypothetical protein